MDLNELKQRAKQWRKRRGDVEKCGVVVFVGMMFKDGSMNSEIRSIGNPVALQSMSLRYATRR